MIKLLFVSLFIASLYFYSEVYIIILGFIYSLTL